MKAKTTAAELIRAAQKYRDNHHWVPLRLRGKNPDVMGEGWNKRTLENAVPKFKEGDNIGILLGAPSGDLVRLDADFAIIPRVVEILFPEPTLMFGRRSAPRSGRLYVCPGLKTTNFKLPNAMKDDKRLPLHDGEPSRTVFQVLSTGAQTMAPPSIHPTAGEEISWLDAKAEPKSLPQGELLRRVGIEAFCMAVCQFWPARGVRNEAAWSLARVLLTALANRYPNEDDRIAVVDTLVTAVAMAGGDGEASRKGKQRAAATLQKMKAGEQTTGLPRLLELLELPQEVAKTFRAWLGADDKPAALNEGDELPAPSKPMAVARVFVARKHRTESGELTLRYWRGAWWCWRQSHWREAEPREIRSELYAFTEHGAYLNDKGIVVAWAPNRHKVGDLLEALGAICWRTTPTSRHGWIAARPDQSWP